MSFLQPPPPTQYDLNFSLFGIPVRVHPLFWLIAALFGATTDLLQLSIWIVVVFVSILIHELGHSLMMRVYGIDSYIVLFFGGLAVPTTSQGWRSRASKTPPTTQQLLISLAGPFIGFLLAAIILAGVAAAGGIVRFEFILGFIPNPSAFLLAAPYAVNLTIYMLLFVNVFWGLFNLIPVFPLDGGQAARQLFIKANPWDGVRQSLWLSVVVGAIAAIVGWVALDSLYIAFLFGLLAFQSYQALHGGFY